MWREAGSCKCDVVLVAQINVTVVFWPFYESRPFDEMWRLMMTGCLLRYCRATAVVNVWDSGPPELRVRLCVFFFFFFFWCCIRTTGCPTGINTRLHSGVGCLQTHTHQLLFDLIIRRQVNRNHGFNFAVSVCVVHIGSTKTQLQGPVHAGNM